MYPPADAGHGATDRITLDHGPSTVAGIVDAARRTHRVPVIVLAVDPRTPARAAAHRALLDHELDGAPTTLAWLLPVGTTPEPGTLVALVDTWRRSPSAGLIGPKHLDADDPHLLRALAIRTTRGGRLLLAPRARRARPGPVRPVQRRPRACRSPGSLVERDLLVDLRGWETSFGDVGADLDLGWRAHNAGRRVVVVPAARMHTEPGVAPAGASTASRRRSARRVALARSPWWASPFLAAWIAVTSVVAAVGLLLLKRPRSAGAELSSLASLDPFRGTAARWRTRHRREVSRRDLRALFEPRRAVLTGWGDAVHDALVSPRPPIGDEANDLNPRSWMVKVVRHPGVLAMAGAARRLGRRGPLARGRCHHRRRVGAVRRRADGQPRRRLRALARLDRRLDRRRPRRPRPGRPLGAAAGAAHLAGRPPPAAARPRLCRRASSSRSSSSSGCRSRP